ncbi:metallophosphoesterase [Candidatus Pacearchaeota archaeon]|nr:metallophosphoesterase [Candidatus Pacearchaeota archaeon]
MKDYKFIGKSVFLEKERILVITDIHLGYEEMLNQKGIFVLREQYKKIISELEEIFAVVGKIKEIIILGDLKHEFSGILGQEWKEVSDFIDFLKEKCRKIVLIKGNHDNMLKYIAERKEMDLREYYISGENIFIHGDKDIVEILDKKIKRIFLGHLHPSISLRKVAKEEKYKCFLVGRFKGKEVVILPSFFPLVEGSDVYIEDTNLGIDLNLEEFEVYIPVSAEEVLDFGKLGDVGKLV